MGSTAQYWTAVTTCALLGAAGVIATRHSPARAGRAVGRVIAAVLALDAASFVLRPVVDGSWTARGSLPLDLCDVALVIAAVSCCVPRWRLGTELTYFWGLAGTLQAVVTPDLSAAFPSPEFLEFVVGHVGIVIAALYLVTGLRIRPRVGSVPRVLAVTVAYTTAVGVVDWIAGANYMYLRREPGRSSLLSVLGPWPWYLVGAAAIAVVAFLVLDAPFRRGRGGGSSVHRGVGPAR